MLAQLVGLFQCGVILDFAHRGHAAGKDRPGQTGLFKAVDPALQAGDRIVSVDGTEIASKDDLGTLMQEHAAGDTLSITIARDGQMQTVNVTLGEKTASNS